MADKSTQDGSRLLEQSVQQAQEAAVVEIADQGLLSLNQLVQNGAIDVAPKFQRRDRWGADKQSLLIESFLTNIPVPPVYLAEDAAAIGSYAVIDGKQRLTAVSAFFSDSLSLRGLERLPLLNGKRFTELPAAVRNTLSMKNLRVTTLLRQSNEDLKHEVFLRLNTGGEVLNAQEIRNVAYRGPLNDLVFRLAENTFLRAQFKVNPPSSPAYRQMTDAEYVIRFFALAEGWHSFKGELRMELDKFMIKHRFADGPELRKLTVHFEHSIEAVENIWGDQAFKRPGRDQALAGLFDAQMIAVAQLRPANVKYLIDHKREVVDATRALFDDRDFDEAVRQGTNTPSRLRLRTTRMLDTLRQLSSPAGTGQ